ncbi:MAG: ATP synthase F0 subunit C [Candidatus Cloacimonetes bacterium]|nr:ATP synthase F0 subunit C [Candidatus Cloacimonadota bacterium]
MINPEVARAFIFFGAGVCTGLASIGAGFGEGQIAGYTMKAIGRQPGAKDTLLRSMLISQALTESGAIFALVVSLLLLFGGFLNASLDLVKSTALLASALAMGLGSLGPSFGSGHAGAEACDGIGRTPSQTLPITTNMLIGQALSQTASIFALVVSFLLIYTVPSVSANQEAGYQIMRSLAFMGAAIAMGIGSFGPGVGVGYIAGQAGKMLARYKEQQSLLMRTMFLSSAVAQSTAIYALVVSLLLIFM